MFEFVCSLISPLWFRSCWKAFINFWNQGGQTPVSYIYIRQLQLGMLEESWHFAEKLGWRYVISNLFYHWWFEKVLGIVENMSGYVCPHCSTCTNVFSSGGGRALAEHAKVENIHEITAPHFFAICRYLFLDVCLWNPSWHWLQNLEVALWRNFQTPRSTLSLWQYPLAFMFKTCNNPYTISGSTELDSNLPSSSRWIWWGRRWKDGALIDILFSKINVGGKTT